MLMHNDPPRIMPGGEQDATFAAVVLDVFQRAHHERYTAEEAAEAE